MAIWIDVTATFATPRYGAPQACLHGAVVCASYPAASVDPQEGIVHYTRASDSVHVDSVTTNPVVDDINVSASGGNSLIPSGGYWILNGDGILHPVTITGDANGETGSAGDCVYNAFVKPYLFGDGSAAFLGPTRLRITYKEPVVPSLGQNIQVVVFGQPDDYFDPCQSNPNPWGANAFPLIGDTIDDQVVEFDIAADLGSNMPYALSLFVGASPTQDYVTYPLIGNEFHWVPIKKIEVFADVPSPFWTDFIETEVDIDGTLSKSFNEIFVPGSPGSPGQPYSHECPQGPPVGPPGGGYGNGDGDPGGGDGGPCFVVTICQRIGAIEICIPLNTCPGP